MKYFQKNRQGGLGQSHIGNHLEMVRDEVRLVSFLNLIPAIYTMALSSTGE